MKEIHAAIKTFLPSVTDKEILKMSRAADADGSGHVSIIFDLRAAGQVEILNQGDL